MANNNNKVRPILGLKPQKPKKMHYLFAMNKEDFAEFTGSLPYELKQPITGMELKRVFGCVSDKYVWIYCNQPEDIRGLTKIEASFTDFFKNSKDPKTLAEIKAEIQICNFVSVNTFNPEYIPNVLKEMMADQEFFNPDKKSSLHFPCVGMVVKSEKNYPLINVNKGDHGIIVSLFGNNQEHANIIFSNGGFSEFTREELIEDLIFSHLSNHYHIRNYNFKDTPSTHNDFHLGTFDAEFWSLKS